MVSKEDLENGTGSRGKFGLTRKQLINLVETPKEQAPDALATLGGVEGVAEALHVRLEHGLDQSLQADLDNREACFGKNYVEPPKAKSILELMWDAFQDVTLIVLSAAGVVSLILGVTVDEDPDHGWIEGATILVAVLIVLVVTALNDYQKEKQFRALNAVREDEKIKVIRDGVPAEVSKFSLLVGDIVRVDLGDILPADGIVIEQEDLKADESAMTGESKLISKDSKTRPFLLSGTKVMEGFGKMIVVCVGESSQSGIISKLIAGSKGEKDDDSDKKKSNLETVQQSSNQANAGEVYVSVETPEANGNGDYVDDEEIVSPLQGKLNKLTIFIGKAGISVALIVFVAMSLRFSIETFAVDGKSWRKSFANEYVDFFIVAVTVLVVAIPEGLPLAVTISLAYSVKKMLKDNNLVRHLDACETMGSATTICSDKTGTLTTNRMTVMRSWIGEKEFDPLPSNLSQECKEALCSGICINSTAEILPPKQEGGHPEHTGNKTECALLQFCRDLAVEYPMERSKAKVLRMITFSSAKKRMSAIIQRNESTKRIYTKGATEVVLGLCKQMIDVDGKLISLSEDHKQSIIRDVVEKFASEGLRTLCLAYRDVDESHDVYAMSDEEVESELTCVAIVGIEDPVRPEVPDSISKCRSAGITVRMVTGDNITTARSIAYKCGIISPNDGSLIMEGKVFRERVLDAEGNIIQAEFDKIWPMLRVLARSSPRDKHTLVTGLIQSNLPNHGPQVVAVTGDGTNDAPALKRADVGFAMGISGTAVAKDASDIILMDDNFVSIVSAVKWGRNVYDSISKFLQFQLTVNLVAISVAVVGAIALEESPLTAVQLLWVNLIMDTFASLALATEEPTAALLNRKPYSRTKPLISKTMTKHIIGQSIYQLIVLLIIVFAGDKLFDIESGRKLDRRDTPGEDLPTQHYTIVFNAFVFMQLFNELNARKIHDEMNIFTGIIRNKIFLAVTVFQVSCQVLIVEFGGRSFHCTGLTAAQWGWCLLLGFFSLPIGAALRLIRSKELPKWMAMCREPVEVKSGMSARSQELWMRGLHRIRAQIRVVNAFKRGLQASRSKRMLTI